MLRISGMTVLVGALWCSTEVPVNALHFRDDVAIAGLGQVIVLPGQANATQGA